MIIGEFHMYDKASFVFWTALGLYIFTLLTVPYVGVYLTYIVIPLIVLSGIIMKFSIPKKDTNMEEITNEVEEIAEKSLKIINDTLKSLNESVESTNTFKNLKDEIDSIRLSKIQAELILELSTTIEEKVYYENIIKNADIKILKFQTQIEDIKKQCEIIVNNYSSIFGNKSKLEAKANEACLRMKALNYPEYRAKRRAKVEAELRLKHGLNLDSK